MKTTNYIIALLISIFMALPVMANEEPLPPDQAFKLEVKVKDANTVLVTWTAAKGYYLYHNKFKFKSNTDGIVPGSAKIPAGKKKQDAIFGLVETHRGSVTIELPISRSDKAGNSASLTLGSQGCADIGICYPPYEKTVTVSLPAKAVTNKSLGQNLGLQEEEEFLPPDKAFALTAIANKDGSITASWQIADKYYMYRDKFRFQLVDAPAGASLGNPVFPKGKIKQDPAFNKELEVYYRNVSITIPVHGVKAGDKIKLKTISQGCAEAGLCYPPAEKMVELVQLKTMAAATIDVTTPGKKPDNARAPPAQKAGPGEELTDIEKLMQLFKSNNLPLILVTLLGFGLLLAFTACMYPMIPILSSIIVGQGENISAKKGFFLSLIYVESMAITFGIIGMIFGLLGKAVGVQAYFQNPWVLGVFAILFVLLALSMFGLFNIQMPAALQSRLNEASNRQQGGTLAGVAIMGILSALIIGPCGGPILIAALGGASLSDSGLYGFLYLFMLGNGMGLPLLAVGAGGGKLLPKAGNWMNVIKAVAGVILLSIALLLLERMPTVFSPMLIMLLWAMLFIVSAIYMGALEPLKDDSRGINKLFKGLGVFILVYGIIVMLGGLTGAKNFNDPMHGSKLLGGSGHAVTTTASGPRPAYEVLAEGKPVSRHGGLTFIKIKTIADLKRELAAANKAGKTVMLDFYADWCTYCKQFYEYTFPDARVKKALFNTVLLVADVTKNDAEDKALMKHVNVPLPPAMLFYRTDGTEARKYRVIGFMKATPFLERVNKALKK